MYQNMSQQPTAPQQVPVLPQQHLQQPHATPYSAPHNFPSYQAARMQQGPPNTYNPNAPRPIEAYRLSDHLNNSIPPEIRSQFPCDDQGRVLFFTNPPLDVVQPAEVLGHSVQYLAAREQRKHEVVEYKRKRAEEAQAEQEAAKKRKLEEDARVKADADRLMTRALQVLTNELQAGTDLLNARNAEYAESIRQ
jgi:chromatin structure-remodeling complex subunit RSC1/2